jgi:hypothetical protein
MAYFLNDDRTIADGRLWGARVVAGIAALGGIAGPGSGGGVSVGYAAGSLAFGLVVYWVLLRLLSSPGGAE